MQSIFSHRADALRQQRREEKEAASALRQQQRDKRKAATQSDNDAEAWKNTPSNIELQQMGLRPINHQSPSRAPPSQRPCQKSTPEKFKAERRATANPQDDEDDCVPSDEEHFSDSSNDSGYGDSSSERRTTSNQQCDTDFPDNLAEAQSKFKNECKGLTLPRDRALLHPAASLLTEHALQGCPADCGEDWSIDKMVAAIAKGPHPTANSQEAAECCWKEAEEKQRSGQALLFKWSSLRKSPPKKLKMSPVACVPHKSRMFRLMLDLSYDLRMRGKKHPSVNEASAKLAPQESMGKLGTVIPRFIEAVAKAPHGDGPIHFAKFDIKDGFWRMAIRPEDAWNFACVLPPKTPGEDPTIVVPTSLQMGWTESPPFFCSATETVRDIAEDLLLEDPNGLPAHRLERLALPEHWQNTNDAKHEARFCHLMECYVDDFCALMQSSDPEALLGKSRAILNAIDTVFPGPDITGQAAEDDPILLKKILQGEGVWHTRKEILGWLFDGVTRCVELPPDKVKKLSTELKAIGRRKKVEHKRLEKSHGGLQHASTGMPVGKPLLGPTIRALHPAKKATPISNKLKQSLRRWRALIREVGAQPTQCKELVSGEPGFIGCCDAAKQGAGGAWFGGTNFLRPTVWRIEWPQDIQDRFWSADNPQGDITNSDLEMAALLMHWLVLEQLAPSLKHEHVEAWSDNTPTVSWATRLNSTKSEPANRLVMALAIRQRAQRASPLVTMSIAGIDNTLADVASRSFGQEGHSNFFATDADFILSFQKQFPLPQGKFWRYFRPNEKLKQSVNSELRGDLSAPESWRRITKRGGSIGTIGNASQGSVKWIPISKERQTNKRLSSSLPSLSGSGQVSTAEEEKSRHKRHKSASERLARPSHWLENPTPSMKVPTDTSNPSIKPSKG